MNQTERKPRGPRIVAYLRISRDMQDVRSQRESIQRWADALGIKIAHWYEDVGSRDLAYKRQDFQKLMTACENGQIDAIIVDAKDRFGTRNAYEFGKFASQLQENDVELWSVTQGCLTDENVVTEVMATIDSVRSRDEQQARSQRSIRSKVSSAHRAEWTGGYPPWGWDVACVGPDGKERWRLFYTGHYQRLRIWPDGRPPERFDGKGVVPGRDPGEVLKLVPSQDKTRIEFVRKAFHWMATEQITIRGICMRLNELGVKPGIGEVWYSSRLKPLLQNPVYVEGVPVWGKRGGGRFYQLIDGRFEDVPRRKGRALTSRKREQKDWVSAKEQGEGMIDRDTWDQVQAKLRVRKATAKAPRNSALWLAGLCFCGHCSTRMQGWSSEGVRSYTCSTYRKAGKTKLNLTGCRLHRVRHEVCEQLVLKYLDESGTKLDQLLALGDEERLLDALARETDRAQQAYLVGLTRVWREVKQSGLQPPVGKPWSHSSLCRAYKSKSSKRQGELAGELQAKQAELDRLVDRFATVDGEAVLAAVRRKMAAVEAEIAELKERMQPLDERLQVQRDELFRLRERVAVAESALAGSENRRKAEAVSRVIGRLVLFFEHRREGGQDRSILTEAVIEPLVGDAVTVSATPDFRGGTRRGPN
jgi:site-specific DNA recombinase